jgi:hypothetical protein
LIEPNQAAKAYLPDNPANHVNKDYLITVINTLDPQFLPKLITEIEEKKLFKPKHVEEHFQVDKEMFELLQSLNCFSLEHINLQSLSSIKSGNQLKRKRS